MKLIKMTMMGVVLAPTLCWGGKFDGLLNVARRPPLARMARTGLESGGGQVRHIHGGTRAPEQNSKYFAPDERGTKSSESKKERYQRLWDERSARAEELKTTIHTLRVEAIMHSQVIASQKKELAKLQNEKLSLETALKKHRDKPVIEPSPAVAYLAAGCAGYTVGDVCWKLFKIWSAF